MVAGEVPESRTWIDLASAFVDVKWPHASARHSKGLAEGLVTATVSMYTSLSPAQCHRRTSCHAQNNIAPEGCFLSRQIISHPDPDPEAFMTDFANRLSTSGYYSSNLYAAACRTRSGLPPSNRSSPRWSTSATTSPSRTGSRPSPPHGRSCTASRTTPSPISAGRRTTRGPRRDPLRRALPHVRQRPRDVATHGRVRPRGRNPPLAHPNSAQIVDATNANRRKLDPGAAGVGDLTARVSPRSCHPSSLRIGMPRWPPRAQKRAGRPRMTPTPREQCERPRVDEITGREARQCRGGPAPHTPSARKGRGRVWRSCSARSGGSEPPRHGGGTLMNPATGLRAAPPSQPAAARAPPWRPVAGARAPRRAVRTDGPRLPASPG